CGHTYRAGRAARPRFAACDWIASNLCETRDTRPKGALGRRRAWKPIFGRLRRRCDEPPEDQQITWQRGGLHPPTALPVRAFCGGHRCLAPKLRRGSRKKLHRVTLNVRGMPVLGIERASNLDRVILP